METASESKKNQKQKAKDFAKLADSYELHPKRPLSRNGWFAFALCPICVCAAIVIFWAITQF